MCDDERRVRRAGALTRTLCGSWCRVDNVEGARRTPHLPSGPVLRAVVTGVRGDTESQRSRPCWERNKQRAVRA